MAIFNLALDFTGLGIDENQQQAIKDRGFATIFEALFNNLITVKHKTGVNGANLRTLNRIYKKLDSCVDNKIDLEAAEIDLLKDIFMDDTVSVLPVQVRIFMQYRTELEKCIALQN